MYMQTAADQSGASSTARVLRAALPAICHREDTLQIRIITIICRSSFKMDSLEKLPTLLDAHGELDVDRKATLGTYSSLSLLYL